MPKGIGYGPGKKMTGKTLAGKKSMRGGKR